MVFYMFPLFSPNMMSTGIMMSTDMRNAMISQDRLSAWICAGHLFPAEQWTSHGGLPDPQGPKDDRCRPENEVLVSPGKAVNPIPMDFPMDFHPFPQLTIT